MYTTNIYYSDSKLETTISNIAHALHINSYSSVEEYNDNDNALLFYDGFGINDRGLIQIYLNALCKVKKVIYVTYEERKDLLPDVQNILNEHRCERRYIKRIGTSYINQINQLNSFIKEFRPEHIFIILYQVMWLPHLFYIHMGNL